MPKKESHSAKLSSYIILVWLILFTLTAMTNIAYAQKVEVVKVGALLPLTGALAQAGGEIQKAIAFMVDEINQAGGIKALGGAKLEVIIADHRMKPEVAMSETERLIEREKVVIMTDFPPSATTIPATTVAERLKTPYLVALSYANEITERGFKYTFQQYPTAHYVSLTQVNFLDWLGKKLGRKLQNIGLIYEDTDYGQSVAKGQKIHLKDKGYTVVADVSYPFKSPNLEPYVNKLVGSKPDAVLEATYMSDGLNIDKITDKYNLNVPMIDLGARVFTGYSQAVGPWGKGQLTLGYWNSDYPHQRSKEMASKFEARYKEAATGTEGIYLQTMLTIKEVLEKAASIDKEAIRSALATIEILPGPNLILPFKKIKFDEKGLNIHGDYLMLQIVEGKYVTIWPEETSAIQFQNIRGWK